MYIKGFPQNQPPYTQKKRLGGSIMSLKAVSYGFYERKEPMRRNSEK
jgi:hypothetical protein